MQLNGAFFANHAEVVDDMLNVVGGCWSSTTVANGSTGFASYCVVLCEATRRDNDQTFRLSIDATGPTGQQWADAHSAEFTVSGRIQFMVTPPIILPIEPQGGRHTYTFRLGDEAKLVLPLHVYLAQP
jgi:hypothetical protein